MRLEKIQMPVELCNIIYSYIGIHPVAKLIKEMELTDNYIYNMCNNIFQNYIKNSNYAKEIKNELNLHILHFDIFKYPFFYITKNGKIHIKFQYYCSRDIKNYVYLKKVIHNIVDEFIKKMILIKLID